MKKYVSLIFASLFSISLFAQTTVAEKKLGKELEKNKDTTAVFVSEINLSQIVIAGDEVNLPLFAKNKLQIVSGMDFANFQERISFAKKSNFRTTFVAKDLSQKIKVYTLTNVEGIETVEECQKRLAREAKERWERERLENLLKYPVQVVNQKVTNLSGLEVVWLPSQIQDKLKSNFHEYLGLKTIIDSKSESTLKEFYSKSEKSSHNEFSASEFEKITAAKFALFTKLQKTGTNYIVTVDFTDLTTGEKMASATSKEYSKAEYLYSSTGAVDELTLAIGSKLEIKITDLNKKLLESGSANLSVEEQLSLAKQNEEQFNKLMKDYDSELSQIMTSNDNNSIQNKNRIEAEKALLVEKKNAEKKRQDELKAQIERAAEDEKLEAERSVALKTQRDKMAKEAAEKASEIRKLKIGKQGVLGQITAIESKKKALVEIRQSVESRTQELYDQLLKDKTAEESRIRNKTYSTVELGGDGQPTEQAKQRRENQVVKSNDELTNKFFADAAVVKASTQSQDTALLSEIRADQKLLTTARTVSSIGDELKVSFGTYEGGKNGWNAYLSLYSDGVLIYADNFIVSYEALSGKKAPDMATELKDSVIEEYTNNVDTYNSLLIRGVPVIYFEIDYNVVAESDDMPSQYKFNFSKIRVINTVSGKVTQTSTLNNVQSRKMNPEWDLREIVGVVHDEWIRQISEKKKRDYENEQIYDLLKDSVNLDSIATIEAKIFESIKSSLSKLFTMKKIPGKNYKMMTTEVTQKFYEAVMGNNPSQFKGENNPVENISWFDAVYFCNKLSKKFDLTPVYSVKGYSDTDMWGRANVDFWDSDVMQNPNANGFRLPTTEEWKYAAKGGQNYKYSGSSNLNEVGWVFGSESHPVAQKKINGYGLFDMTGNVDEWCWDGDGFHKYKCGGSYYHSGYEVDFIFPGDDHPSETRDWSGFRIVCNAE